MKAVLYIHGSGGTPAESEHYKALFPGHAVLGLDYRTATPWETGKEIRAAAENLKREYEDIILIANSIGAYFSMHGDIGGLVRQAYFISPIIDMEGLITGMMARAGVTDADLRAKGVISTPSGEELSWDYLSYVRSHPIRWAAPTRILYGSRDALTSFEAVRGFARKHGASLTVMENGEHWFHTEEQMRFLDDWLRKSLSENGNEQKKKAGDLMEKSGIVIRRETEADRRAVEALVRESFWNVYRPGCLEHYVIHQLRNDPAFVPELDFVMEKDGALIGQNMFMRAAIQADDGRDIPIMTMGPIGIAPAYKGQGYGKLLLDYSLEQAAALGCGALCFEGNIGFYGKSGFTFAGAFGIRYRGLPEGADASFFLCRELIPGYLDGVTGEYGPPAGYLVDAGEAEEFDRTFPLKKKEKLPGQIF